MTNAELWNEVKSLFNAELDKDIIDDNVELHGEETYLMDVDFKALVENYIQAYAGDEDSALQRIINDSNIGFIYCGKYEDSYYILFN